jgi:hypothetical protein
VMRGYDRPQVDEHIRRIEAGVRQHRDQARAMRRELSEARRQIQERERPTTTAASRSRRSRHTTRHIPTTRTEPHAHEDTNAVTRCGRELRQHHLSSYLMNRCQPGWMRSGLLPMMSLLSW